MATEKAQAEEENPDPELSAPTPAPANKAKPATKSPLPEWRLEQLRKAAKARGEQLKRDKAHQSHAAKALVASRGQGYMQKLGKAAHAKALEANPDLQSKAAKATKGTHRKRGKKPDNRVSEALPQPIQDKEEGQKENE